MLTDNQSAFRRRIDGLRDLIDEHLLKSFRTDTSRVTFRMVYEGVALFWMCKFVLLALNEPSTAESSGERFFWWSIVIVLAGLSVALIVSVLAIGARAYNSLNLLSQAAVLAAYIGVVRYFRDDGVNAVALFGILLGCFFLAGAVEVVLAGIVVSIRNEHRFANLNRIGRIIGLLLVVPASLIALGYLPFDIRGLL